MVTVERRLLGVIATTNSAYVPLRPTIRECTCEYWQCSGPRDWHREPRDAARRVAHCMAASVARRCVFASGALRAARRFATDHRRRVRPGLPMRADGSLAAHRGVETGERQAGDRERPARRVRRRTPTPGRRPVVRRRLAARVLAPRGSCGRSCTRSPRELWMLGSGSPAASRCCAATRTAAFRRSPGRRSQASARSGL